MEDKIMRNHTLDIVKLVAAFLVVFIHVPFYGIVGDIIKSLARVAVPLFFMTSGFFCYKNNSKTILRKIKKLFLILVFTSCLYNFMNIIFAFFSGGISEVVNYFLKFLDIQSWLKLLFFNLPFSATRLWFLFALIYVYLLQILFDNFNVSNKVIFLLSFCGIVVHIFLGSVLTFFGVNIPDFICRNFLLFGYPFFALGLFFRKYEKEITKTPKLVLVVCGVIGCILSIVPLLFESVSQISIGTLFLVFAIFSFALMKSEVKYSVQVLKLCKCSLGIYIFHKPVTTIMQIFFRFISISEQSVLYRNLFPILVCVLTSLLTLIIMELQIKTRNFYMNKK